MEKIVIEKAKKLVDLTLTELCEKAASPASVHGGAAIPAMAASLASALGSMAASLALADAGEAGDAQLAEALKILDAARGYLLRQADEDAKALAPLNKFIASGESAASENYQASLRVACFVPTEVMYTSGRCLEQLAILAEKAPLSAMADIGAAAELCLAVMRSCRLTIISKAALVTDEVFAMTLRRECELVIEQYAPVARAAADKAEARLG